MSARIMLFSLLVLLPLATVSLADHLPDNLQLKSRPEKTLAGIRLGRSKLSDVIKMYGEPPCLIKEEMPAGYVDTHHYYWYEGEVRLHVVVFRSKELVGDEYIAMVEIEGSAMDGTIGRTGAGLKLGSGFSKLKRIYGRRFHLRNIPEYDIHDVMVQWRSGYSLVAELNQENIIKRLSLFSPE